MRIDGIRNGYVYIIGEEKFVPTVEVMSLADKAHRYFIKRTNIPGVYTYGIEQLEEECLGHSRGYVWASRTGVMNRTFDVALTEALYKKEGDTTYRSCAIDLVRFEELLNTFGYEVNWTPREEGAMDIKYDLIKKDTTDDNRESDSNN